MKVFYDHILSLETHASEETMIQLLNPTAEGNKKHIKIKMVEFLADNQKKTVITSILSLHELVPKVYLVKIRNKAGKLNNLSKTLSQGKYSSIPMDDCLFGLTAAMLPQARMSGVATVAPLIIVNVLENSGIEYNTEKNYH